MYVYVGMVLCWATSICLFQMDMDVWNLSINMLVGNVCVAVLSMDYFASTFTSLVYHTSWGYIASLLLNQQGMNGCIKCIRDTSRLQLLRRLTIYTC